jgi:putative redox protein
MEVKVIQAEGVRFKVEAREHSLICDQPQDNGGTDQGMTPPELMLASLGTCAAFYAVQYLKARNLADGGVEVRVTAEKLKQPARLGNFQIDVSSPVPLTPEQEQGMMNAVHHCLIHNTLLTPPQIDINLHLPQTVG